MSKLTRVKLLAILLCGSVAFTYHQLSAEEKPKTAVEHFDELIEQTGKLGAFLRENFNAETPEKEFQQKITPKLQGVMDAAQLVADHAEATDVQKRTAKSVQIQLVQIGAFHDTAFGNKVVKDHPGSELAAMAETQMLLKQITSSPSPKLDDELKAYAKRYPDSQFPAMLYNRYAQELEAKGDIDRAIALCKTGLELFAESPFASMLESTLISLNMIGKPIEISGPTLDGSPIDIKSLKGKVVLVDFWATWCGPCVAELPGVKKVFDEYHEKGFEIVGVSLDQDKDALKNFVEENEMPWPQIIHESEKSRGFSHPLAEKYKVEGIPRMILVGKDGNVVASSLRGEEHIRSAVKRELSKEAGPSAN